LIQVMSFGVLQVLSAGSSIAAVSPMLSTPAWKTKCRGKLDLPRASGEV
jgi:hypothetical protein